MNGKKILLGMNLEELQELVTGAGMQRFVGRQLAEWIYGKAVTTFDEMANISIRNKEWLKENCEIGRKAPAGVTESRDGTRKYLFKVYGGNLVESVYIPDHERATLCVSSQSGCKMNCYFCATGRMGFKCNLSAAEILNQILSVPGRSEKHLAPLTNIVFMGMGEPLDNWPEVRRALDVVTASWGLAWSPKRVTVSTVGKLPQLKNLLDETDVHVAVSVHTPLMEEREQIMPAQKAFPLKDVLNILRGYDFSKQRRLSIEYIMWMGVNDDMAHARALERLLHGLHCRVNLIRFHAVPGVNLRPCSEERMVMFRNFLNSKGITATIRASRGEDIMAACGMLAAGK
ncbi:MAG: 23S rRNA (adenine(2503)-C(2))-methyltransferase RlmN [Muribaculaceae bacterium]|nr:23S rRNA (adenine(2503)-C(2))-methyltransferase RlmN [Muribaculaceae bacterium]